MTQGQKKQTRDQRRRQAQAKARRKRLLVWAGVAIVAIGITAFFVFKPVPEELAAVERFDSIGSRHLAAGEAIPVYNSSPATSGDHSSSPAQCGIYLSEIPDEIQLHNLEHGTVAIFYQPDLDPTQIDSLQAYARSKSSHILLSPRTDLSDPVVVTSWTRMLRLQEVDITTIDVYYDQFAFKGLEAGVPCPFQVDESL